MVRFTADGAAFAPQWLVRWAPSCPSADAEDGFGADLPAAKDQRTTPPAPDMAISASPSDHRSAEPGLVRGRDLHSDAQRLPVPRRDHGLVQPKGSELETIEHDGCRLLRHSTGGGDCLLRQARDLQHRSRLAVYQLCLHQHLEGGRNPHLDGRPRPLDGQRLHRAAVAIAQIRMRLPQCLRDRQ